MTAFTDTIGFNKGTASYGAGFEYRTGYVEVELDFAAIIAARSAAGATALAAADTLQVLHVPANSIVLHAGFEVMTAESTNTTATFDLGFTGGSPEAANYFVNDGACDVANVVKHTKLANAAVIGTSDDTIDLLINTAAPTDTVLRVFAFLLNPN